jgi:transcriptional regulator with XRE-family HTH domain
MLAPEQSRAARGWLAWTQEDLAKRANVSLSTVRDFEAGRRVPIKNNLDAMRLAFEIAGAAFVFRGEIASGIQFRLVDQAA